MNSYTEYELLTQKIISLLGEAKDIKTINIQHDAKLKGKSGQKHQIDVLWDYELNGKRYRFAIECKDYNKRVSLGTICCFNGVLIDLEGIHGIMVTKVGYQEGAKRYADYYNISLKELRPPRKEEKIGCIKFDINLETLGWTYSIDEEWAKDNKVNLYKFREYYAFLDTENADFWRTATHLPLWTEDKFIRGSNGDIIASLDKLEKEFHKLADNKLPVSFSFENGYLRSKELGTIKILEAIYGYNGYEKHQSIDVAANELVKDILKDVRSDKVDIVSLY